MVVTPRDALQLNSTREKREVAELEKMIDGYLKENNQGRAIYISVDNVNEKVYREIRQKYLSSGWKVKMESDQREGDYFVFSEARK